MRCEQARDMLLTDGMDGRLSGARAQALARHLAGCAGCREFAAVGREVVQAPFALGDQPVPPERVWARIRGQIMEESAAGPSRNEVLFPIWGGLRWPAFRLPILALSTLAVVVWVAVSVISGPGAVDRQARTPDPVDDIQAMAYLADVLDYPDTVTADEDSGYGTDIEEVFLQS